MGVVSCNDVVITSEWSRVGAWTCRRAGAIPTQEGQHEACWAGQSSADKLTEPAFRSYLFEKEIWNKPRQLRYTDKIYSV